MMAIATVDTINFVNTIISIDTRSVLGTIGTNRNMIATTQTKTPRIIPTINDQNVKLLAASPIELNLEQKRRQWYVL